MDGGLPYCRICVVCGKPTGQLPGFRKTCSQICADTWFYRARHRRAELLAGKRRRGMDYYERSKRRREQRLREIARAGMRRYRWTRFAKLAALALLPPEPY